MHNDTKKKMWIPPIESVFSVCCVVVKELPVSPQAGEAPGTQDGDSPSGAVFISFGTCRPLANC